MDGNTARVSYEFEAIDCVANVEYMYAGISSGNDDRGNGESDEGLTHLTALSADYSFGPNFHQGSL